MAAHKEIYVRLLLWSRGVTRWFRCGLSVSGPFVCRCLTNPIVPRLHTPLIEPDRRS
jgi:hypothetical protein